MGTISKQILSGSSYGKPIPVVTTGTLGTTIHTTGTSSIIIDEVWLYANNIDTVQVNLTIEYGAAGTGNEIKVGIPAGSGLSICLPGVVLTGDGSTGSVVTAYASSANKINIVGYVNRINP
jgi:hypothetical protein